MRATFVLAALSLVLSVTASYSIAKHPHPEELSLGLRDPGPIDVNNTIYRYLGDGKGQSRSPCPFMNTAANHGILPYDGKNILLETYRLIANKGGFSNGIFSFTLRSLKKLTALLHKADPNHPLDRLDLEELGIHGPIEHDLSFTRWDVKLPHQEPGDTWVAPELVEQLLQKYGPHGKDCYITGDDLMRWRHDRKKQEEAKGLRLTDYMLDVTQQVAGAGEVIFTVELLGRDGKISCQHAESFLIHERFPIDWKAPPTKHLPAFIPSLGKWVAKQHAPSKVVGFEDTVKSAIKGLFHRHQNDDPADDHWDN